MSAHPSIEFHETMAGGFALGATDPEDGARQGETLGTAFRIDNVITIADVDEFCRDRERPAQLSATVDFPPFGPEIRADPGTFQLFVPSREHAASLMIYRFEFEHRGVRYFFNGQKYMHGGHKLLKLWRDSTHLYATLHRGENADAPIAGAGILGIGPLGTLEMARSMRVLGARTLAQRVSTRSKFNRYVLSGFWGAYTQ